MARWKVVCVLLNIVVVAAFALTAWDDTLLSPASLQAHKTQLGDPAGRVPALTLLVWMALCILATTLSVPGALIRSVATGFLFGAWVGTLAVIISATVGGTLAFLLARYLFAAEVRQRFASGRTWQWAEQRFRRTGFMNVLTLRLVPLVPFLALNLMLSLMPITLRTYIVATAVGIAPASIVAAATGETLATMMPNRDRRGP